MRDFPLPKKLALPETEREEGERESGPSWEEREGALMRGGCCGGPFRVFRAEQFPTGQSGIKSYIQGPLERHIAMVTD